MKEATQHPSQIVMELDTNTTTQSHGTVGYANMTEAMPLPKGICGGCGYVAMTEAEHMILFSRMYCSTFFWCSPRNKMQKVKT